MVKLFMKDLLLNKVNLAANLLIYTGLLAYFSFVLPAGLFVGFACVMLSFVPVSILAREDKFKATVLNCSLPVTRKKLVLSRYLNSWILALAGLLYILSLGAVVPVSHLSAGELFNLDSLFLAFVILSVILSLVLPFVIRFGFVGLFAMLISLQLLGALLFLIQVLFRPDIDRDVIAGIAAGMEYLRERMGTGGFHGAVAGVLLALNLLSLKSSQALFEKRDL